jgi:hypothetical protein
VGMVSLANLASQPFIVPGPWLDPQRVSVERPGSGMYLLFLYQKRSGEDLVCFLRGFTIAVDALLCFGWFLRRVQLSDAPPRRRLSARAIIGVWLRGIRGYKLDNLGSNLYDGRESLLTGRWLI